MIDISSIVGKNTEIMSAGFFITFEGSEGCGKSTHIKRLETYLESLGFDCIVTREPGGTSLGETIRKILLDKNNKIEPRAELLLFEAARAQHAEELILPALKNGKIVICDRFADSSTAYQGVARKLSKEDVSTLNSFAIGNALPDLTILLDIPAEVGLERAKIRDKGTTDRMGSEKLPFYYAVRNAFIKIAENNPDRVRIIDSTSDIDSTFEKIRKVVTEKLNVGK